MNLETWIFLLTLLGTVTAPAIFSLAKRIHLQDALNAAVAVLTAGILLFQLLPESLSVLGIWALALVAVGAGMPGLIEHLFHRAATATHVLTLSLGILGLLLHATMDGSTMTGDQMQRGGLWLPFAVALHRLPVAMSLWWLARRHFGTYVAILVNLSLVLGTVIGFMYAGNILESLSGYAFHVFQSLVAGSVLHVLFHRPHPVPHHHAESHHSEHKSGGVPLGSSERIGIVVGGMLLLLILIAVG